MTSQREPLRREPLPRAAHLSESRRGAPWRRPLSGAALARASALASASVLVCASVLALNSSSFAQQGCLTPPGDITAAGNTNVVSVQCGILVALQELSPGTPVPPCLGVSLQQADLNCDDTRNVSDVQLLISYTLGQALNPAVDADQNSCPDACELFNPVCGDGLCTDGAENCFTCAIDCGVCQGDCCADNGSAGCDDPAITSDVCTLDATCCTDTWGASCASLAAQEGACPGDCCIGTNTPNCDDPTVASCVCNLAPECCTVAWDASCVALAESSCGVDCPLISDCCSVGEVGGCTNLACESCVCGVDSLCCDSVWDASCVEIAKDECAFSQVIWATLSGDQHNPPIPTAASGSATFALTGTTLSYFIEFADLEGPEFAAHIHNAPAGENGPIVIPLPLGNPKVGSAILTPALVTALLANELYINVHSNLFLSGELRGQIIVDTTTGPCECATPCCDTHDTPGCDVPDCETCVCNTDPFCCASSWDAGCEAAARGACAAECECGTGDCCAPNATVGCDQFPCESCVCGIDDFCCSVGFDETCAGIAAIECSLVCGCAPNDCCAVGAGPGCENPGCEDCVCDGDLFCCNAAWDGQCVSAARAECNDVCLCEAGDCCQPQLAPGCKDDGCAGCVCAADDFCCLVQWDELCVGAANTDCNALCGCAPTAGADDCCSAHASAGCDQLDCQACVCDADDFCCSVQWDELCVNAAGAECASSCACGDGQGACCEPNAGAGCENPACEDCVCDADSACCDVMWDAACVATAAGDCNGVCLCETGDCCQAQAGPGCDAPACVDCVCASDDFCCDVQWDEVCVGTGKADCNAACQCDAELGTESCCSTHASAGCQDAGCQGCVCGNDDFCCATGWDGACLGFANQACDAECGCGGGTGDCCAAHGGLGCEATPCSACVCDAAPECCSVAWDGACSALAAAGCNAACACGANCCEAQGAPNCGDATCEGCVCGFDDFCCDVEWDEVCAGIAEFDCGGSCSCP